MTLGERIKKVRRYLNLTQAEFASRIGSTQNALTGYETGRRNPSSSVINNICKTFDVSEMWLRNEEGEMLSAKPTAALDALALEHSLSNSDYILIEKFLNLKPATRKAMTDYMREVVAAIATIEAEGDLADAPAYPFFMSHGIPQTMNEVGEQIDLFRSGLILDAQRQQRKELAGTDKARAKAEEYYRQLLLEEEQEGKSSVSPSDTGSADTERMA